MENIMWKLVILGVTAVIVGVIGFESAQSNYSKSAERGQTAMPSIEKMTVDAKELPAQTFVAY
jgi:hypothetical protein